MDILVLGDNHGDIENVLIYLDKLASLKFDVVVYYGDFTDVVVPKGFTQEGIAKLLIEELKTLGKPLVAVPGNNDTHGIIRLLEDERISIHGKGVIIDKVGFYGYGGAKTPFKTTLEPSEEEMRVGLEKALACVKNTPTKVQVTHCPPYDTRVDMVVSGSHVGSKIVREFIEEKHPVLSVSGHIHEARGVDRLGETVLINAGRFPEGYVGLVNIEGNTAKGRIINLLE